MAAAVEANVGAGGLAALPGWLVPAGTDPDDTDDPTVVAGTWADRAATGPWADRAATGTWGDDV
jgi:hypothetical protein